MKKNYLIHQLLVMSLLVFFSSKSVMGKALTFDDLLKMSLEDLMQVRIVTSVSKKEQKLVDAAAAVFLISQIDIQRSGATTLPELLRMVPGLEVARFDAYQWDVAARGFSGHQNGKLLILIDGRTAYSPLTSTTPWQIRGHPVLEDIERIEVIRGPGGTLWGANAVNGVINIITKNSKDTQGGMIVAGGGTEKRNFATARYGGKFAENGYYRIYGKTTEGNNSVFSNGDEKNDDWRIKQGGFRLDQKYSEQDSYLIEGNTFQGNLSEPIFTERTQDTASNILARWNHVIDADHSWSLQMYYDMLQRDLMSYKYTNRTYDIEFQNNFMLNRRNKLVWGMGYRYLLSDTQSKHLPTFQVEYIPARRSDELYSAFLQNEFALLSDELFLTLGSKVEHNEYSGWEVQPNARLLWKINQNNSLWSAISRAVRTPSQQDHTVKYDVMEIPAETAQQPVPVIVRALGNSNFDSETTISYELGWRSQLTPQLFIDLASYFNHYDRLFLIHQGTPYLDTAAGKIIQPLQVENGMDGEIFGAELSVDWQAIPEQWRLQFSYTWLKMQLHLKDGFVASNPRDAEGQEKKVPEHQVSIRSMYNINSTIQLDTWLRYVDALPLIGQEHYFNLDVRLGWKPRKDLEFSLIAQNLLEKQHAEFGSGNEIGNTNASQFKRGVYLKGDWRF